MGYSGTAETLQQYNDVINRKVYIVKGYSKTEREAVIDNQFCEWYSEFFTSSAGGAYHPNEVEYLIEPESAYLSKKMSNEILDFGIIILLDTAQIKMTINFFNLTVMKL
ncbi:MAG: hypothetical protein IR153_10025 [Flavobacterium sp.]|nr:hypothetical protein [Flavobacterium sp.]